METPLTWLEELSIDTNDFGTMHVNIGVEYNQTIEYIDFVVSLSSMGLRWDDEFEFEFSKDLQRDMNSFYSTYKRIPSAEEYKKLTERHIYSY